MGTVLRPVFGKPCCECEEQVPMARVRILESDAAARGHSLMSANLRCVSCEATQQSRIRRMRAAERPRDITIIRG